MLVPGYIPHLSNDTLQKLFAAWKEQGVQRFYGKIAWLEREAAHLKAQLGE